MSRHDINDGWPIRQSASDEARARTLHDDSIIIDMVSMGAGGATIFNALPREVVRRRILHVTDPAVGGAQVAGIVSALERIGLSRC